MVLGILISTVLVSVSLFALWCKSISRRPFTSLRSVAIVVLGDIGRSPRMLYHAQSFASHEYVTYIIAYEGSDPPDALRTSPNVHFVYLSNPLAFASRFPKPLFLFFLPLRMVHSALLLLLALLRLEQAPSFILVQNPPAIPTLPIVKLAAILRRSRLIIDWHNTGYSVLALRLGERSWVVQFAKWIEVVLGRHAFAHLCVTLAMKKELIQKAQIRGIIRVFHDRPPSHFRRLTLEQTHELLLGIPLFSQPHFPSLSSHSLENWATPTTMLTALDASDAAQFIPDRPRLIVSATSWTPDEDFDILLRALDLYDGMASQSEGKAEHLSMSKEDEKVSFTRLPRLLVVITGRGSGQAAFQREVQLREEGDRPWKKVKVRTAWLKMEDYPKLLGSADLGICLHTSTSGVDLPMKVVDMFGCDLPVCALNFPCINELVTEGVNGMVFDNPEMLADQLKSLLLEKPQHEKQSRLDLLRAGISNSTYAGEPWCHWEQNWENVVAPLLAI